MWQGTCIVEWWGSVARHMIIVEWWRSVARHMFIVYSGGEVWQGTCL